LKVAIAPDQRAEALTVPPEPAVPEVVTTSARAYTFALLKVVAAPDTALATCVNEFNNDPRVKVLLVNPIPPIHNSFAWTVAAVVPVEADVLLPEEVAVASNGLAASTPEYSITATAEKRDEAVVIVTTEPAPETPGAYQISVVAPEVPVEDAARVHVAPVWLIELTAFTVVLRVDITATRVLPL
jgi:phage tail sheath protein FI